jgi:photosystem II stability/assembly factor-like uncharacterized protein
MKNRISFLVLVFCFLALQSALGQQKLGLELKSKLKDKSSLSEIMREVDSLYNKQPQEIKDKGGDGLVKYKHWKRWEYEMGRSLGENGAFVNRSEIIWNAYLKNPRPTSKNKNDLSGSWKQIGAEQSNLSNDTLQSYTPPSASTAYANGLGRVDRIAFHPTNANILYVATPYGGLWVTEDGGQTWNCLTDQIPSIGISGIVVDKVDPNILYILTGTADYQLYSFTTIFELNAPSMGVMKSVDAGASWYFTGTFPLTNGVTSYITYDLVQDPNNAAVLFAATSDGIFKTANSGGSWTKVKTGKHFDLHFHDFLNETRLFSANEKEIFYSLPAGISWTSSIFDTAPTSTSSRIAITSNSYGFLYALAGGALSNGRFQGAYKSIDSGTNFILQSDTPNILGYTANGSDDRDQAEYDLCIAANWTSHDNVTYGGINVWGSTNGGADLSNKTVWYQNQDTLKAYIHADQHALAYNPLDLKLYSCNDGGIYVSTNNGSTWTNLSKGLYISQFYHLAKSPQSSYKLAGGLQDNGIKYRAKGTKDFTHMAGADGFSTSFNPLNPDVFYITRNQSAYKMKYSDGSQINGSSWEYYPHILAHPVDTNIVFIGGAKENFGPGIWKSTNQGANFTYKGGKGSWAMAIAPSNPAIMYAAGGGSFAPGNGGVYSSDDSGESWSLISSNPGFPNPADYNTVTDIAIDPYTPENVFVTIGGFIEEKKIYYSGDGGSNWINLSNNLPNVVAHSVAVVDFKIYVGTDISLYRRDYADPTWVDIGDNLPYCPITEILPDNKTGKITIATFGRGVWERAYCVTNVTLTEDLEGYLNYQSSNVITSSSLIPGNDIDAVTFKAGGKVVLSPGFQATIGSHFVAKTDGCVDGGLPLRKVDSVSKQ